MGTVVKRPRRIVVPDEHYAAAEDLVDNYLSRAADDAWCHVLFDKGDGTYAHAYRAGNRKAVLPKEWPKGLD